MKKPLLASAILFALTASNTLAADEKMEAKAEREKCYGVAKAEKMIVPPKMARIPALDKAKKTQIQIAGCMYPKAYATSWQAA